jgi:hypothetical protein
MLFVSQVPLNPQGGPAVMVRAKLSDADVARLIELAGSQRKRPGTVVRELLQLALRAEQRGNSPPAV